MNMDHDAYAHVPENYTQPGIFQLIKEGTLRKMGKLSKEAIIQKTLKNSKYIRDRDIPIPDYDATASDPMPDLPALPSDSLSNGTDSAPACKEIFCRIGCVCQSINCEDMYDDHYEKHCRDTGDPACMFGCVCNNGPGPKANGESRWVISKPYKYKRPRVRDDEDCGFIPLHLRLTKGQNGRPKRTAQPPTRYRPDLSKQERLLENGKLELNGICKASTRPRRRLCEEEEDDGSDESYEKIYTKTRSRDPENNKLNINSAVERLESQLNAVNKRRWAKLHAARSVKAAYAAGSLPRGRPPKRKIKSETVSLDASDESDSRASGNQTDTNVPAKRGRKPGSKNGCANQSVPKKSGRKKASNDSASNAAEDVKPVLERLREPSKRERKPRRWDLLEPEPRPKRPYNRKNATNNGHFASKSSGAVQIKQESKPKAIVKPKEHKTLTVSTFLHVIQIQQPSKTCQGMYAVLRNTSAIITFVSWDQDANVIPHLQEMQFRFTGSSQTNVDYDKACDLVLLPHIPTQDTIWFFYSLKRDYLSWTLVMFPELHALFATDVLCGKIRACHKKVRNTSQFIDVSNLNVNGSAATKGQYLYLFLGQDDDIFLCGTPPDVFMDKNPSRQAGLRQNALLRVRSESVYRTKPTLPTTKTYAAKASTKVIKIGTSTSATPAPVPVPVSVPVPASAPVPVPALVPEPVPAAQNEDVVVVENCSSSVLHDTEKTLPEDTTAIGVATPEDTDKTEPESSDVILLTTLETYQAPIISAYEIPTAHAPACDFTIAPTYDFTTAAATICDFSSTQTCGFTSEYEFSPAPGYEFSSVPACEFQTTPSCEITTATMVTLDMEVEPTA